MTFRQAFDTSVLVATMIDPFPEAGLFKRRVVDIGPELSDALRVVLQFRQAAGAIELLTTTRFRICWIESFEELFG